MLVLVTVPSRENVASYAAGVGDGAGSGAGAGQHRTEAEMLLDPEARLGQDGLY